jgi:hypothetical protein
MTIQNESTINIIRGKNIVGKADKDDVDLLFEHIDALEEFLDEYDYNDWFGTEGWRHTIGLDD